MSVSWCHRFNLDHHLQTAAMTLNEWDTIEIPWGHWSRRLRSRPEEKMTPQLAPYHSRSGWRTSRYSLHGALWRFLQQDSWRTLTGSTFVAFTHHVSSLLAYLESSSRIQSLSEVEPDDAAFRSVWRCFNSDFTRIKVRSVGWTQFGSDHRMFADTPSSSCVPPRTLHQLATPINTLALPT